MMTRENKFSAFYILILCLTLTACSAGEGSKNGRAVTSLDEVKQATIQIEAQGSFEDPHEGLMLNVAGRGSGFIIDSSGIAITNNHVVTGAAFIKVWVAGEDEPYNARVIGASECSDLAVIDIEGDGFSYLEWYDDDISVGTEVYAAGFPLGDPEFTLTRGIVSKERSHGDSSWASVDNVIEHDATINPGNSGGPLVSVDGKVIGINYAGSSATRQFYAITRDEALKHIDQLRAGIDVTSIGVNGVAVNDGEGLFGIWVASVKSGSPADVAGIKAGDIIVTLEGLVLSTNGTMADYCDVLRTHGEDAVMSLQVLRFETAEFLEGRLNGPPLEVSFSFGNQLASEVDSQESGPAGMYTEFVPVTDESGEIEIEVPVLWNEVDGFTYLDGMANVTASPNLVDFRDHYVGPGMAFAAWNRAYMTVGTIDSELDYLRENETNCAYDGRYEFEKPGYKGKFDVFKDCNGAGGPMRLVLIVEALDPAHEITLKVRVQVVTEDDLFALDHMLDTFRIISEIR